MQEAFDVLYGSGEPNASWETDGEGSPSIHAREAVGRIMGWDTTGDLNRIGKGLAESTACPSSAQARLDCYADDEEAYLFVDSEFVGLFPDGVPASFTSKIVLVRPGGATASVSEIKGVQAIPTGKRLAAAFTATLVQRLRKEGFQRIVLEAAGKKGSTQNGYYTWASFGFNLHFDDEIKDRAYEHGYRVSNTHDLIDGFGQRGLDWWKDYGRTSPAMFDLSANSRHLKMFSSYLAKHGQQGFGL